MYYVSKSSFIKCTDVRFIVETGLHKNMQLFSKSAKERAENRVNNKEPISSRARKTKMVFVCPILWEREIEREIERPMYYTLTIFFPSSLYRTHCITPM